MAAALAPLISFLLNTDQVIWGIAGISPISPFRPGPGHGLHPIVIWMQSAHDWPHVVTVCVLSWGLLQVIGERGDGGQGRRRGGAAAGGAPAGLAERPAGDVL